MAKRCELYRHFDKDGQLLYVGISYRSIERLLKHRSSAHWFDDIVRVDIERFSSRREALDAEMSAIKFEKPLHNIITDTRKGILCRSDAEKIEINKLLTLIDAAGYGVRRNSCRSVLATVWKAIEAGQKPDPIYLTIRSSKPAVNRQAENDQY